jgi:hypothetical protein
LPDLRLRAARIGGGIRGGFIAGKSGGNQSYALLAG